MLLVLLIVCSNVVCLFVFEAILKAITQDTSVTTSLKQAAANCLSTAQRTSDLAHVVQVCHFSKCFVQTQVRFELALDPRFAEFADLLPQHVMGKAGHECFGAAPRNPLERQVAAVIGQMMTEQSRQN